MIDYDELEKMAIKHKPKLILAGFSAYTRQLDYKRFQQIAKKVGAILTIDIAHIAGLIAGKGSQIQFRILILSQPPHTKHCADHAEE